MEKLHLALSQGDLLYAVDYTNIVSDGGIGMADFWAMMIFLAVLVVGFIYELSKGALEW